MSHNRAPVSFGTRSAWRQRAHGGVEWAFRCTERTHRSAQRTLWTCRFDLNSWRSGRRALRRIGRCAGWNGSGLRCVCCRRWLWCRRRFTTASAGGYNQRNHQQCRKQNHDPNILAYHHKQTFPLHASSTHLTDAGRSESTIIIGRSALSFSASTLCNACIHFVILYMI